MEEVILVNDRHYILATSPMADDRTLVLKQGETFAVFDRYGDIRPLGRGVLGLYHEGTRFLSRLELSLEDARPLLLSSTVKEDNAFLTVDLTNADAGRDGRVAIPRGTVHLFKSAFLWQGACYLRLRLSNYGLSAVDVALSLTFDADYVDVFEVRGTRRTGRGRRLPGAAADGTVTLAYEGLDGAVRRTRIAVSPPPATLVEGRATLGARLEPRGQATWDLTVACDVGEAPARALGFDQAAAAAGRALTRAREQDCLIDTSNEQFNDWLNRSLLDLHMMVTDTEEGPYPYAGVPWFSTPFGRDGLITALELLWVNPALARGVLAYLAATQAVAPSPEQDAEPGKILHEARLGEMAALREIPFGRYYGTVDATPLFVMLAGAYYERTGDRAFIKAIRPNVEAALRWMDGDGDKDGDGFIEYARRCANGLDNHGWRDSHDAVFHADGRPAEGPIALCEVQAYAYEARLRAAELAEALGDDQAAGRLRREAERLRERFEAAFWSEARGTYALALDGDKRPCLVRSSSAGHCLLTGITAPDRARRAAEGLLDEAFFSGWGIRTIAATEARYNPMSYHNGSVWPHDNALIALGFARYRFKAQALRILTGLFDASRFVDLHRMPELFCGFPRRPGEGLIAYPLACAPQAWASGAVFLLLQACLGLTIRATERRLYFVKPVLPAFLQEVRIRNLKVGEATLDLLLRRHDEDVGINVTRRGGTVEVVTVK